jgi:hypothetical protein
VPATQYDAEGGSESERTGALQFDPLHEYEAKELWELRASVGTLFEACPTLRALDWSVENATGPAAWWVMCNALFEVLRRGAKRAPKDAGRAFAVPYVVAPSTGVGVIADFMRGAEEAWAPAFKATRAFCCLVCLGRRLHVYIAKGTAAYVNKVVDNKVHFIA